MESAGGILPEVCLDTPTVGAPPGGKGEDPSFVSKQEPSGVGQSTADDTPLTPPPEDKDVSLFFGAAPSGRVISPHIPSTPNSDHQPTSSESLAVEKERSESALAPTAALSLSLDSVMGQVCVCVHVCVYVYICVRAGMNSRN